MIRLSRRGGGRGTWVYAHFRRPITGVSIDSRTIRAGDLFVALRGERFDGHDYVAIRLAAGAGGAVVDAAWWDEGRILWPRSMAGIAKGCVYPVEDTLEALGRLANAVRRKSERHGYRGDGQRG